jgi:hypothetical protein
MMRLTALRVLTSDDLFESVFTFDSMSHMRDHLQ